MKLVIDKTQIRNILQDLYEATKVVSSIRDVNYKGILIKNNLTVHSIVASSLPKFLIKKNIIIEIRRGRLGTTWEWNPQYPDIGSILERYKTHLDSINFELKKKKVTATSTKVTKPSKFNLGDKVYVIYKNAIRRLSVMSMNLVNLDNPELIEYQLGSDDTHNLIPVEYEDMYMTIDELIESLKEKYYKDAGSNN